MQIINESTSKKRRFPFTQEELKVQGEKRLKISSQLKTYITNYVKPNEQQINGAGSHQ